MKQREADVMSKKILLLGGAGYAVPVIKAAHELGCRVITCDYLPDNTAHQYSDAYENISITDKDAVLRAAWKQKVDGVMSFACDPGVVTAAYVAEKMGLSFQCSYEAACILQDKGRFRQFLKDNGFHTPNAKKYWGKEIPCEDMDYFNWPVIVKPSDSAGSKGVTKVTKPSDLEEAAERALQYSRSGSFIIEDFLEFKGYHSSADSFSVNGRLEYVTYSDQLFDSEAENGYVPSRIIWPCTMNRNEQEFLSRETQRLIDLLHMNTGIYNIETCLDRQGRPYLMEVSPRGGGCRIAEIEQLSMGVQLIENEVRQSVGMPLIPLKAKESDGCWCEMVIHAAPGQQGIFQYMEIDPVIRDRYMKMLELSVKQGDAVWPFTGANMALGDMFLRFASRDELDEIMAHSSEWLRIITS